MKHPATEPATGMPGAFRPGRGADRLLRYRFLMGELVLRELKIKYKRSILGILWSVLSPLLMMLILNIVFSRLFRFQIPNYLVYYLTGSLVFSFMQEATAGSLYSVFGNAGLISKVYVPKFIFPLAKSITAFVNLGFALVALLLVATFTGIRATPALVVAPPLFLFLFFFVTGLCLVMGASTVFFRDLIHFHGIFMMMWMYLTPIFYPESILPSNLEWLVRANPVYYYVRCFRTIVLDGAFPETGLLLACAGFGIASLAAGFAVFRRTQDRFFLYF